MKIRTRRSSMTEYEKRGEGILVEQHSSSNSRKYSTSIYILCQKNKRPVHDSGNVQPLSCECHRCRSEFCNPHPTHTCDGGMAGFVMSWIKQPASCHIISQDPMMVNKGQCRPMMLQTLLFSNMCPTCIYLPFFISDQTCIYPFYLCLPYFYIAFYMCLPQG